MLLVGCAAGVVTDTHDTFRVVIQDYGFDGKHRQTDRKTLRDTERHRETRRDKERHRETQRDTDGQSERKRQRWRQAETDVDRHRRT